jgi:hypothetical protein
MKSLIYDFETLGTNHAESAVVSLAALVFDSSHFKEGYTYDELLDTVVTVKFDVADQVRNHGRKIDPNTLKWWGEQSAEAQKQLKPLEFDPMFMDSICAPDPYPFWKLRDTRSTIEGMTLLNKDIKNGFIVPGLEERFIAHDAKHDVAMDVMRMQFLMQEML